MAKKSKDLVVVDAAKVDDVVNFAISEDVVVFAASLGVDLAGAIDDRADIAADHMNRSQRHMLAAGLLLASIKAECDHGTFLDVIGERGFEQRAAYRAMSYAEFIASQPEAEREKLIGMPKYKVLALASADPEVIDAMRKDGVNIDALSVRALTDRIRELEAGMTDVTVQRDTAEAELEGARKKLAKKPGDREDAIPHAVADLRAELLALGKKAELAIDGFNAAGVDVMLLVGTETAHEWADATLRLATSNLIAIRLQLDGVLKKYLDQLPGQDPTPTDRSFLSKLEVVETAQRFAELTALHNHEKALREWEAEQKRPKGKGRPSAKPEAPKAGA